MSRWKLPASLALAVAAAVVTAWWMLRTPAPPAPRTPTAVQPVPAVPVPAPETRGSSGPAPAAAVILPTDILPIPSEQQQTPAPSGRLVAPDSALATVNGVTIVGKDILPFPDSTEQSMTPEMFEFLLQRAIERELVFQAARREGIELDDAGRRELARLRASLFKQDPSVIKPAQPDPAAVEFQERDATGLLLRTALLNKSGRPAPLVTKDMVDAYYHSHPAEYDALPDDPKARDEAWRSIELDIRNKLVSRHMADYAAGVAEYLQELRGAAAIRILSPDAAP